jgi:hypothetical protein
MLLFLETLPVNTHPSATMPLFLQGHPTGPTGIYSSTTLYLENDYTNITSRGQKLFLKGAGAYIDFASMPLYINTKAGGLTTMYVHGASSNTHNTTLWVSGVNNPTNSFSLFTGGAIPSGHFTLFTKGPTSVNPSGVSLYVRGEPNINNNFICYTHGY